MSFNIKGGVEEVWTCDSCTYCSTKKHFREGPACPLCDISAHKIGEQEPNTGMSDFKYRRLLDDLREDADGVGAATVENIEQHFEEGDDFLDAAEAAYQEMELDTLKAVEGVGQASVKTIALTIAESEGWENGALFVL